MTSQARIAIIGAGPGGLALANILQRNLIPLTIYELDSSPNQRNQGGSLDLHPLDGQQAILEAGLWEQFVKHARPESDVMKVVRLDGRVLWDGNGADKRVVSEKEKFNHRPEIDRTALKEILLEGLLPGTIIWGHKLTEIVPSDEKYDLHFANGSIEKGFDVVVGADGAWSKVRSLLTDVKPYYSGISSVEVSVRNVDIEHPFISQYVGAGSCFSFGDGRAIQCQRLGDGSIRTYASLRKPESFLKDCGIDWEKPDEALKEYINTYFSDTAEELKNIILQSTDTFIPRQLFMLPVGFRWNSRPGVTLVGDAAHLMTPFAGVGVNAALADALELARAIIEHKNDPQSQSISAYIEKYEEELFPRGEKFAQKTAKGLVGHFSADGSEEFAKRLRAAFGKA